MRSKLLQGQMHNLPRHLTGVHVLHVHLLLQTHNLPRLLAELGVPLPYGYATLPRAQIIEAAKRALRSAKVKFHPDKVQQGAVRGSSHALRGATGAVRGSSHAMRGATGADHCGGQV